MTFTGSQNRPYTDGPAMKVRATFYSPVTNAAGTLLRFEAQSMDFNWNDRQEVRNFAAQSDRIIRAGGKTELERI
jgi:hypothetical protein